MSRSGYSDDEIDQWDLIRWRGAVKSAIRGKRGQAFLAEMLEALDAMPEKRLIANDLRDRDGEVCALGAVGVKRRMHLALLDPEERDRVAREFGIAQVIAIAQPDTTRPVRKIDEFPAVNQIVELLP